MKHDAIAALLPDAFVAADRPGTPLAAALDVMEALHAPDEALLDAAHLLFDPYRAPLKMLPLLASWVGFEWLLAVGGSAEEVAAAFPGGTVRLRNLVAAAAGLSRSRGTARALLELAEIATGVTDLRFSSDPSRPFELTLHAPARAAPYEALLRRLVAEEKPAHVVIHVHVEVAASTTGVAPPAPPPLAPTSTPSVDTDHQLRKDDE